MQIKKFEIDKDYERIKEFLSECYKENQDMSCWLPERFDDLIFRIDTLHRDERGKLASQDFIYIWGDDDDVVAVIFPDGDSFHSSIKSGYEYLFPEMLDLAERDLIPLFGRNQNGQVDFLVVSHDSLSYQEKELLRREYTKDRLSDYDNVQHPLKSNYIVDLPTGFSLVYGEKIDENRKAKACHYGFKPEEDDGILDGEFREGALSYQARKKSSFFKDRFECLIITDENDICSYCFCYVNKELGTALIEPVCTREQYRKRGLCKQMLHGVIARLKTLKIEKSYINSCDWRKEVYNSAGFQTVDSLSFWYKEL